METSLGILDYAGPAPVAQRSLLKTLCRAVIGILVGIIFLAVVILRAALLASGFACVLAGTLLLMLGGRRSAARKLRAWQERVTDLMKLWIGDILRPLRRSRPALLLLGPELSR